MADISKSLKKQNQIKEELDLFLMTQNNINHVRKQKHELLRSSVTKQVLEPAGPSEPDLTK